MAKLGLVFFQGRVIQCVFLEPGKLSGELFLNLENFQKTQHIHTWLCWVRSPFTLTLQDCESAHLLFFLVIQAFGLLYGGCSLFIVVGKTQEKHILEKEVYDSSLSVAVDSHLFHLLQSEDSCTDVFYSDDSTNW